MKLKVKLRLALGFLFVVILLLGGLGAWYLQKLSQEAQGILKDNYISLEYARAMRGIIDENNWKSEDFQSFNEALLQQERNITELGEGESTRQVRNHFNAFRTTRDSSRIGLINKQLNTIVQLNMQSIFQKNEQVKKMADEIYSYLVFIATFCALIAFSFIINFPRYISDPIQQLTEGLREITRKNYEPRLGVERNDELGEMAKAFNQMAQKLDEYEHSSLARVLFEKRRTETIINQMNDAIIGLDEHNHLLFINSVAATMLGLDAVQIVGRYAPDIALKNDLLRSLLNNEPTAKPLKIFANERESYFSKETLEVTNEEKRLGKVIVLKNITPFHDLDQAKTNFIATISHELKTPIASIKMSLKLLENDRIGNLNDEQKLLVTQIQEDSQRLLKITGELLDLSQVETGNLQLNFRSVSPTEIVTPAVEALQFFASQKQIDIQVQIPSTLPLVQADSDKTTWVLLNFLSNAIRHSPEKSIIEVEVKPSSKTNCIEFSVKDLGKGIDPKYQQRVFERYFQVPSNGQSKAGTGLGLAISKEFIEAQKGNIGVESEIGLGSRFWFQLPVA
ncbi:signal transduction histidine kinase/HAMP domain-containing protein [Runella defluvii]|uniref:histidine kinase n=1 Tax=Runella defluvii TaxID=370973 RepID=A0A7W6EP74_9BACT|nr:ATP-binding protein [Runella defluvii]MBB3837285.1 signal transduction histidine kinase/HAMP domain-containing protein [Runella defluvii]